MERATGPCLNQSQVKKGGIHNWCTLMMFHCLGRCHCCPISTPPQHWALLRRLNKQDEVSVRKEGRFWVVVGRRATLHVAQMPSPPHGNRAHASSNCSSSGLGSFSLWSCDLNQARGGTVPGIRRDHRTFTYSSNNCLLNNHCGSFCNNVRVFSFGYFVA